MRLEEKPVHIRQLNLVVVKHDEFADAAPLKAQKDFGDFDVSTKVKPVLLPGKHFGSD